MDDEEARPPSLDIDEFVDEINYDDYDENDPPPPPELDEDEEITEKYGFVLDSLLFPSHVKEQLMTTQTKEKKLMIIEMHKHLLENKKGIEWGEQQNSLLNLIKNSSKPDIQVLITLRSSLATGNKEFLTGFLENNGIYVLMKCIDERIAKQPMTDLDASILYEVICCCKCTMNNDTGMEALLVTPGAIEHIAKSLFFEWKPIALTVLEILSVCCYYSGGSSSEMVMNGMKLLAKMRNEAPFQILCQAIVNEDIEVKASVSQFVNSMIMGMESIQDRNYLRAELTTQLYIETYESVLRNIRQDIETVDQNEFSSTNVVVDSMTSRRRAPLIISSSQLVNEQSDLAGYIQVSKGKNAVAVNPNNGTMAGIVITIVKEEKKLKMLSFSKGDKLKVVHTWYELDGITLKMCSGKEREPNDFKPVVPMADVLLIRDYTTDTKLSKEVRFALEIETTNGCIALGLESAFDKDSWLTALTMARDSAIMKRSAYRLMSKELSVDEFRMHADMYIKQGTIYFSMLADDRRLVMTSFDLDTADPLMISEFLYHEMVAMGQSDQYHQLLQLLLLMPPGTPKLWKFLIQGVRRLVSCSISDEDEMEDSFRIDMNTLVSLLENKAEELGGIYPQVSKLAMSVMNKETELRQMRSDVTHAMGLLDRVKNDMSESLQAAEEEIERSGRDKEFFLQLLSPILSIPDRLLSLDALDDEHDENKKPVQQLRRRSSSVSEMRYEIYNRMLKSLPDAQVVREKMVADGFSETEILDFFGIEFAMALPGGGSGGGGFGGGKGGLSGMDGEKYKKMLKLLPTQLIREKMLEVGFKDKEIDDVIGPFDSAAAPAGGNKIEAKPIDPKYEKYYKMMKMLPEGAVRQKMVQDGFSEKDIDEFFKQLVEVAVATASGATIAPPAAAKPVDPKYEKFVKMMKMLPEGAVRQKMAQEGLSDKDVEYFFSTVLPQANGAAPTATAEAPAPAAANEKYEKYTKMMKMLPEGAVRQKMIGDGIPEAEVNAFFGSAGKPAASPLGGIKKPAAPVVEPPPPGMKVKPIITPAKKMKGLFWTKLKNTDVSGTVWSEIDDFNFDNRSKELIEMLFSAVGRAGGGDKEDESAKDKKKEKAKAAGVSLFDGKRVQGVLIFLGRVRKAPKEVVNIILRLDPKVMTLGLTETILNICPTTEELTTVKAYETPEKLDLTGQLFYELSTIPRLELRLRCHEITFKWDSDASEASTHVGVFLKACVELRRTKATLAKLLSMVIGLGNILNGGTPRGQAYGVKVDFLAKLATVKMNPIAKVEGTSTPSVLCGPTVLHFLAYQAENTDPEVLEISSTWENVWTASEVSFAQMEQDVKQLESQITKIKEELKVGVPAVKAERGDEASEPLKQRLEAFLQKAEPRMDNIRNHLVETTGTIKTTMAMFGEVGGAAEEDIVSSFFSNIASFIKSFNSSVADNRKMKEEQDKVARKQQEASRLKENRAARAASVANAGSEVAGAIEGKGIFADFKKAQSRQANEIIGERRTDRNRGAISARKDGIAPPGGALDAKDDKKKNRRRPSLVREDPSARGMGAPKNSMSKMIQSKLNG